MSWVGAPALFLVNTVSVFSLTKIEQLRPPQRVGMRIKWKFLCENVTNSAANVGCLSPHLCLWDSHLVTASRMEWWGET